MNGIRFLIPEIPARILYGIILVANVTVFVKLVLPQYKLAFSDEAS